MARPAEAGRHRALLAAAAGGYAARAVPVDVGHAGHAAALGLLSRTMFSADLDPGTAREVSNVVDEASVLAAGPNVPEDGEAGKEDVRHHRRADRADLEEQSTDDMRSFQVRSLSSTKPLRKKTRNGTHHVRHCRFLIPNYVKQSRIPGFQSLLPIIGNLHNLGRRNLPHKAFALLADRYGPLVSIRLGGVRAVVASSHDAAREVL
ncbi:hypothetical protein U9M48_000939 [Paspalum notatum var. saurae]|uniref:Uncharacterized protein n=1 Tax=Paspalum notatum var. saurae TaxID=547442 RepID=A0AAQ3PML4_PASNO